MTPRYNEPVGPVRFVRMQSDAPEFIKDERRRGRRAQGILYERRVHAEFLSRFPGYLPAMWFSYGDSQSDEKWCQTDGLIIDPWSGRLTIVEVKLQHCAAAYYQLFRTYLPVLQWLFGTKYQLSCVEVVRWFDCATLTPIRPTMCPAPEEAKPDRFNVYIWRPR